MTKRKESYVTWPGETEAGFQRAIIDLAHYCGWKVVHFRPAMNAKGQWRTAMAGDKGFPDLVLARRGVVLHCELKLVGKRLRHAQVVWLEALRGKVWTPDDWPEIERTLKEVPDA